MKKVQKTYTAEFKRKAVRLMQASGKPIAQVARRHHIVLWFSHTCRAQQYGDTTITRPGKTRESVFGNIPSLLRS